MELFQDFAVLLCSKPNSLGCILVGETKSKGDNKIGLFVGSKVDSIRFLHLLHF